jgi:hypothetical protein
LERQVPKNDIAAPSHHKQITIASQGDWPEDRLVGTDPHAIDSDCAPRVEDHAFRKIVAHALLKRGLGKRRDMADASGRGASAAACSAAEAH